MLLIIFYFLLFKVWCLQRYEKSISYLYCSNKYLVSELLCCSNRITHSHSHIQTSLMVPPYFKFQFSAVAMYMYIIVYDTNLFYNPCRNKITPHNIVLSSMYIIAMLFGNNIRCNKNNTLHLYVILLPTCG